MGSASTPASSMNSHRSERRKRALPMISRPKLFAASPMNSISRPVPSAKEIIWSPKTSSSERLVRFSAMPSCLGTAVANSVNPRTPDGRPVRSISSFLLLA